MINAYAVHEPGGKLEPFQYDPGLLGEDEVEIDVEYCGICHSDLSMIQNDFQVSQYPFVPGHEVVGTIAALGSQVKQPLTIGQRVGLGWFSRFCTVCEWCVSGNQNLCLTAECTIVGRNGGFADKVRAQADSVAPLPPDLDPAKVGPLFCGGLTVFNGILQSGIQPTDRVGVIGIGGLGHMALRFLKAWGCDVTAFSSSADKEAEAKALGANHFVNSRNPENLKAVANSLDVILSTVNADLDWLVYLMALRPSGKLHFVGVTPNPIAVPAMPLIVGQKSISGSPLGSSKTMMQMLEFAVRHGVEPIVEIYPLDQVNEALEKLSKGQPRYRLVLKR